MRHLLKYVKILSLTIWEPLKNSKKSRIGSTKDPAYKVAYKQDP